jgi:uncharacterized SAM-binding protein YcdF (DUF218 family)
MNILLISLGVLLGAAIVATLVFVIWMHTARLEPGSADALIVLGYRCENDEIHPILKDRLETARRLMSKYTYSGVILSGGSVASKRSEAQIMKDYMVSCGVNPQLLVMETWSRNTVHNMVNCGLLMKERGFERCLIVSNSFHIRRMNYIVNSLGMDAAFYANRSLSALAKQMKLTWQEIHAFKLTLPWLDKVSRMKHRQMMGKASDISRG